MPTSRKTYYAQRSQARQRIGLCHDCDQPPVLDSRHCAAHRLARQQYQETRYARIRAAGLCVRCPAARRQPLAPGKSLCVDCLESRKLYKRMADAATSRSTRR